MDKFDRFQIAHRILSSHQRPVPLTTFTERMECSAKTVRRTFDQMRNFLDAPIEYCPLRKGWHYAQEPGELFELPGLWLTARELQSLALLLYLLEDVGKGLLNEELLPVARQVQKVLHRLELTPREFARRIKILPVGNRTTSPKVFSAIGEAILKRRQIAIRYKDFKQNQSRRTISPQTLVYYRENWYLDAWCHLRKGLRTFALARITHIEKLDHEAESIPEETLTSYFASSYGLFAGEARHSAKLRFLPPIAHEIAGQNWHPSQEGHWENTDYILSIPYSDHRELVGDIMRYMPHVIVEGPDSLREELLTRLRQGLEMQG